jgi:hypothetical protein
MASTPSQITPGSIFLGTTAGGSGSTVGSTPNYFDLISGGYAGTSSYETNSIDLIQTTTVAPGTIAWHFSNAIYKSYMRKLDIHFVSYNNRPNKQVYPYFDGVSISKLIQRPNKIELTSNSVFFGILTPYTKNLANVANISNGTVTGTIDITREKISIGNANAEIIYTELTPNGNTILYVTEFRGYTPNDSIRVGNTVVGLGSNSRSTIAKVDHYSGVLRYVPVTQAASSSPNSNNFTSNTSNLYIPGLETVLAPDADKTYGLRLSTEASLVDNYYVGNTITFFGGKVAGETANIISYNAATKLIVVQPALTGLENTPGDIFYSIGDGRSGSGYASTNGVQSHFTTSKGFIGGVLRLPGYGVDSNFNFKVGKRIFSITDDPNNVANNATSISEYIFSSYSIEEAQTVTPGNNRAIITASGGSSGILSYKGKSPLAQSFYIDEADHNKGVFVPYIDVFFASKGTQPIEMQIRPMVNGYPDSYRILRNATTVLQSENINLFPFTGNALPQSNNANHFTRFTFPAPVYLEPAKEYSFLLVTNDYDYKVYASEVGQKILGTTRTISEQPYLGSLFKSQNATTYNAIQSDDLMFVIHMCQFASQGTVTFNEYKDPNAQSLSQGGPDNNVKMDMFSVMSDVIQIPGTTLNYRYQATTLSNNTMDTDFTDFIPDTRVFLDDKKYISTDVYPKPTFNMKIDMSTDNPDVSPIIFPNRQEVSTAANYINNVGLELYQINKIKGGANYTMQNTKVTISGNSGYSANGYIITDSNNAANSVDAIYLDNFGYGYYDDINITISTTDANTTGDNAASYTAASELDPTGGPALVRYISKTVTLAPGFDAGDLRVYLTASKPPEANVQVYYKVRNSYDGDDINLKNWIRMERKRGVYMDSVNLEPIEMEYRPSFTSNNIIYSASGATYDTFNEFKIKIVLGSSSTSFYKIPYVFDMRVIALPGDVY